MAVVALTFGLILAMAAGAQAQSASGDTGGITKWTPPSPDPRDFEGVWQPAGGGPPPGGAPSGPPPTATTAPGGPVAPAPSVQSGHVKGAPAEIGGLDLPPVAGAGGAAVAAATGSTLQCTPNDRLGGAGGGMSNLWFQDSHEIVMISEEDQDVARKIYLDLATHPKNLVPQPNGNSIGHWEGNTLVVDTIGFGTADGRPRDQHRIERFHKQGNYLIDDIVTISGGRTQTQTNRELWRSDYHVFENVCEEGYDRYQIVNGQVVNPNLPPDEQK